LSSASANDDLMSVDVDVLHAQPEAFLDPEPGAIEEHDEQARGLASARGTCSIWPNSVDRARKPEDTPDRIIAAFSEYMVTGRPQGQPCSGRLLESFHHASLFAHPWSAGS
jgi:hypothetical protein